MYTKEQRKKLMHIKYYSTGYIIVEDRPGYIFPYYLKNLYNGIETYTTDPLYARRYKTESAAQNIIEKLLGGM